ncbi:MAG: hypothetical protein Q9217_004181 [Psora testacea]
MATAVQKTLVEMNEKYASSFREGDLALPPAKNLKADISVTCMDARIDPAAAFGIDLGDAHVIRNAGGNARDAIRSLVISEQLLGTNEILLVKPYRNLGDEGKNELNGLNFQPFLNLEEGVKDDLKFLEVSNAIPESVTISGWVYDVETGKVRQVV